MWIIASIPTTIGPVLQRQDVSTVRLKDLPPDTTIHLSSMSFSRTFVCAPKDSYLWVVTDRYDIVHDIDDNGLVDIPFTAADEEDSWSSTSWPGYAYVAFQTSPGNFSCQIVSNQHDTPYGVSVGDFNGDGREDLVFSSARDNAAYTLRNNGGWSFTEQMIGSGGGFPNHMAVRNVDAGPGAEVLYTDENGYLYQYSYTTSSRTRVNTLCEEGLAVEDINGDGEQDVVCGTGNGYSVGRVIYQIRTSGTWSSVRNVTTANRYYHGIKAADLNGDRRVDIVSCVGATVYVWYNNGGTYPTFTERSYPTGASASSNACEVTIADLDCDGDGDIVWSFYGSRSPSIVILVNNGATPYPSFTPQVLEGGAYSVYGVAVGLVNDDRKADIIAGLNTGLYIYYNTTPVLDSLCDPFGIGDNEGLATKEDPIRTIPQVKFFKVIGKDVILELTSPSENISFSLYSSDGRLVQRGRVKGSVLKLHISNSGAYVLRVRYDKGHLDFFSKAFVIK